MRYMQFAVIVLNADWKSYYQPVQIIVTSADKGWIGTKLGFS